MPGFLRILSVRPNPGKCTQKNRTFAPAIPKTSIMLQLVPRIPGASRTRNIVFDFGGVICDLDIRATEEKFKAFGPAVDASLSPEESSKRFRDLVTAYETSSISTIGFRNRIREHYRDEPDDKAIDEAWNACLAGIPEHRIRLLERIRKNYRIFLLSNSNLIHYNWYLNQFLLPYGYTDFDELFERAWFSFRIGMVKPDPNIFGFILHDKQLDPGQTLFIDDTEEHVLGARTTGMQAYHLQLGEDITDLFRES